MRIISNSEALIIIIKALKKTNLTEQIQVLERLYLLGINSPEELKFWVDLKEKYKHLLSNYMIDESMKATFSDPLRRYFESQLSHELLKN